MIIGVVHAGGDHQVLSHVLAVLDTLSFMGILRCDFLAPVACDFDLMLPFLGFGDEWTVDIRIVFGRRRSKGVIKFVSM